ncbi:hypothetical protein EXIGLDRAFT_663928 [Exidia glandulosa HHB12029]|uniref:Ferritin-like domain-containing protein n=1 Tax=Exidia glandulosa HHB12029 TaxID=1314781 RepID=A0A165R2A9_EXIGL|nr:hypothetical protein EXIGLDRAFT_663928 [Exidia glandulosa HHB12029]
MRTATSLLALSAPLLASAAPLFSRTASDTDILVFQFAHVLEQLETQFYQAAIAKFQVSDFLAAGYSSAEVAVEQLQTIVTDESAHTSALEAAIKSFGAEPISDCVFNFDAALTDVATTMTIARTVELVGVGAYLGAAHLLDDPRFLTAAASILTIESRHQTILNALNGGVAIPGAFDIPLLPNQVLAIAGGFISGCNAELGLTGNAPLTLQTSGPIAAGTQLTFQSDAVTNWDPNCPLFCSMIVGGAVDSIVLPIDQCIVPQGVTGPVAISILSDPQPVLASNVVDQNQNTTVAGPTIVFVDFGIPEQTLSQIILSPGSKLTKDLNGVSAVAASCSSGSCNPSTVDSTSTISNEQATAIAAAGGGSASTAVYGAGGAAAATAVYGASAPSATQLDEGFITPLMPAQSAANAESAPVVGSAGNSIEFPAATGVDSAGLPLATAAPAAGGAAASSDVIVPAMPASSTDSSVVPVQLNAEPVMVIGFDE